MADGPRLAAPDRYFPMLTNHFKIALRSLLRHKSYSVINVLGLSLGIAGSLIIFLLVKFHLSFDTYHAKADRIYRLVTELHFDEVTYTPGAPLPTAKALRNDFPQLEQVAMVRAADGALISVPRANGAPKKFTEENAVAFAEPQFFKIFDFTWLQGAPQRSLQEPYSAVLTRKYAAKYFGTENPIGKVIRLDNKMDFQVTGLLEDIPDNTDRRHEVYLSYPTLKAYVSDSTDIEEWGSINSDTHCFLLLPTHGDKAQLQNQLPAFNQKYGGEDTKSYRYWLQPLADIHFNDRYNGVVSKPIVWSLALVGGFLIVTACVNFVNLATAQALKRSKEVGVRKVIGSTRGQLFWLFIVETSLVTLLAVGLALVFTQLALPSLNQWLETKLSLRLQDPQLLIFLPLLILVVIFMSGSYPALVLSGFQPAVALKGKMSTQQVGGISLRRALVVLQFTISLILIIGTIVVTSQVEYFKQASLGFNKDAIVMLPVPIPDATRMETMRNRLRAVTGATNVSFNYDAPASTSNNTSSFQFDTRPKEKNRQINVKTADEHYLETFGLQLVAGRNLLKSDTIREYLVNEAFLRKMQLKSPQEAIGKNLRVWGKTGPIVGVMKDFKLYSFRDEIIPCCVMSFAKSYGNCAVKTDLRHVPQTLKALEQIWNDTYPDHVFEYQFLDERLAEFYELEDVMLKLIRSFSFIAIFISCLGLYGLVSFMAVQKTKEIGIRKVLGATVTNILLLFTKEFVQLILVAFVIATPLAWWAMNQWLQDFAYRIPLGAGVFGLAMVIILLIAALTVGYQSVKAALANPVKSLRTE